MSREHLRTQQIEAILANNWGQLRDWKASTNTSRTLHTIPDEAAQVFIPKRILELAENPDNVHLLVTDRTNNENKPSGIGFLIYETRKNTVSDPEAYQRWITQGKPRPPSTTHYDDTFAPNWVDYKHIRYNALIEKGVLSLNDFVFLEYLMDVERDFPHVVHTRNLFDRKELRGIGIGGSFYDRLESVLKELEFRYLTGVIWSPNPSFFANRRTDFSLLTDETKDQLPRDRYERILNLDPYSRVMVKLL